MAENAIDMAHFPLIHQYYKMPEIEKIDESEHQFTIKFAGTRKIFSLKSLIDVELNAVGLGVVFGKTVTDYLTVRAIHAVTPINEQELLVVVTITYNKTWNLFRNFFYKLFLKREVHHFTSGDRIILGNKMYRKNPVLCKNDGPIPKFRRWALKFY